VVVFNSPGANANAVKELVLLAILTQYRNSISSLSFVQSLQEQHQNDPSALTKTVEKQKKLFRGSELQGKKIGIIGLGAIGTIVANSCDALGMQVFGYDPKMSITAARLLNRTVEYCESIEQLLSQVDIVSLHIPLIDNTKGFFGASMIKNCKAKTVLLNFSRAAIVDQAAVLDALNNNQLSQYICDFPNSTLIAHSKCTVYPHLGASTVESEQNCSLMACRQVVDFLQNGNIVNSVNFPNISLKRSANAYRIALANYNVPNVLSHILSILSNNNVLEMINRSRDNLAYNLFDLEQPITDEQMQSIKQIDGVILAHNIP